ncbi:MAG TPA: tetratricopeptide repeat protein [Mucilaginibacter sp.]|nr:tetratricopeptide repeat protein [Mucilaginibacter sp.]
MKIKFLMTALSGLIAVTAFAQKGQLNNANDEYAKYQTLSGQKVTAKLAQTNLSNAKAAIDKAAANEKTAALPQTYTLKAAIYASIAVGDSVVTTATTELATATEALKKARETDTKKENTTLILHASQEIAQYHLNRGVADFQNKKFNEAYQSFDAARQIMPEDTSMILNTAIAAYNAQNYPAAITNYSKLTTTNYSAKDRIYTDLSNVYLANKDTAGAIKSISEAVTKYPKNGELRKREIEISLRAGQQTDLIAKIDAAIKNDPENKSLYYYQGLTYSQIAESAGKDLTKLEKTATKAAQTVKPGAKTPPNPQIAKLQQTRADNFSKASEMYKKATELDQNYFEAVLNLGYVTMAPAIDLYNSARFQNDNKVYAATMAKANAQFDAAKPYLLKAVELDPKSSDALTNLKSYYLGKQDSENANAVQKKLDALGH